MILTGNEILSISPEFLNEMTLSFGKLLVGSASNTLSSVIFNKDQMSYCLAPVESVGIGIIRVAQNAGSLKSNKLNQTESLLVSASVDAKGAVIDAYGGVQAISTCPIYCGVPPMLGGDLSQISYAEITSGVGGLGENTVIKLGAVYFSNKVVMAIMSQRDCQGVKAYLVVYPNGYQGLAICGVNGDNIPQVGIGQLIAYSNVNVTV